MADTETFPARDVDILDLNSLPKHYYDMSVVDLHDLIVILNFQRGQRNSFFQSTKLVEVTKTNFETTRLPRHTRRIWNSTDASHRLGMVFDVDPEDHSGEEQGGAHEWDEPLPKYFTPKTMVKQPIPPSLSAYTPKQLETIFWQAQNHGGSHAAINLIECLFETWPDAGPLIRVRIPPSEGNPKVEYVTSPFAARKTIKFTIKDPKELSVIVTPAKTFVNGTRGQLSYSVIGFSPMRNLSSAPGPVDTILDLSSLQHGDAGRAYEFPFTLTRKEEYVREYLPKFAESNTFSRATYHDRRFSQQHPSGYFDDETRDTATWARKYYMMKKEFHSSYCAYCGMPEMYLGYIPSLGAPMMRCSTCKDEYYCSRQHQKLAWSYHRHFCQPAPIN